MPSAEPRSSEQVGIILVHGVGEQRRFEHLASQLRDLIRALNGLKAKGQVEQVSVDISGSGAAAFQAEHDTWNAGPEASVTVVVNHRLKGELSETRLMVHEVWWADVNEPYSIAKQFRFWLWGLAVWAHPGKQRSSLATADRVAPPVLPEDSARLRGSGWDRIRLFLVGFVFVLVAYSIGTIAVVLNRLINWQSPNLLKVMTNYVSAVKLYNQPHRLGPGLPGASDDFLDSIDEPPRVSVRRRMIRAIADVACNDYARWYVLAHSQGSVVAFNGLMETAYAWPGYLNQDRWNRLMCHDPPLGGPAVGMPIPDQTKPMMPRRPAWLPQDYIAYRSHIFRRFQGFLTYGSPLEKFAGLWPALVPISRELSSNDNIPWINVYDPIDPISGRLLAFTKQPAECCPQPQDLGYAAGWILLLAHLKYLTGRNDGNDLATATVRWLNRRREKNAFCWIVCQSSGALPPFRGDLRVGGGGFPYKIAYGCRVPSI